MMLRGAQGLSRGSSQTVRQSASNPPPVSVARPLSSSLAPRSTGLQGAPQLLPAALPFSSLASSRHANPLRRSFACASAPPTQEETFTYRAEVDRLMDMIVNSLYSNREVFLRELVSNASDALDKVRFVSVTNPDVLKGREELEILISADKEKNTITIEDSGNGMTRDQLLSNLGTIASSGTRKFMEAMKEQKGANDNLIGQFGVGFYSAFLVADRVRVVTKSIDSDATWGWEAAAGSHEFKVTQETDSSLKRGTRVVLHLKEDATEFADPVKLSRLIKQYSQFISFPIKLYSAKKEPRKVTDEEATAKKQEAEDKRAQEKGEEPKKVEAVTKTVYDDVWDWRMENDNKPIWTRNPKDVSDEAYNEFFKQTFSEFLDPLAHLHFNVEGTIEFSSILYIPGMAPFDQQTYATKSRSIKLYVKRVFISDEFDESLMPRYLNFIKGVVDSSDLPLNVSREILQESRITRVIRRQLVRRSLEMMENLASKEGGEDYKTFWEAFGRNLKIGVIEDTENREKLSKLLRFFSSRSEEDITSLDAYVSRMKPGQKDIFYMAADSVEMAKAAPFVEKLVSKGYEVLYLTDAIDEATITNMQKFGDYQLTDVSKEGLELEADEGEKAKEEALSKEFADVVDFLKKSLAERVEKVTVSNRLTDSPCALVTSKFGWSANMERIMRTQAMGDPRTMEYMKGRKILEINPEHSIVRGIKTLLVEKDEERAKDLAELLYETSLITSGFQVDSPKDYASKVFTLINIALGLDPMLPEEGSSNSGNETSSSRAVEAEVVDPNDPWSKN
nr:heat shock protein 90C [Dunaliella salina]|mmetsp:Transcript_29047/g.78223  ORF Transcript_29047/g.78223 Transcript_29047/m.78223 type:complete len:791 (+) Transcript_29047:80-2452(+)|eukprot:CAMPEP_0202351148 /NCGR_PEP_ID=MMETSP1126-20121109/7920_1 /ASSEMBLY_ACC=CAM_ASM_000457 /TAXON_ID=3047 /ORGANISM="Dunaliella tertiolecta, Strain CCMP1320" /LENGTH=790 /DNA_ID=CAMNT_0048943229 /DNA_START=63 /DNA_END=2435 /DNA_ORIENTATION=+